LKRRLWASPSLIEATADLGDTGHDGGADGIHHVIGVSLQQCAEHQHLVECLTLRLGLDCAQHADHTGVVGIVGERPAAAPREFGESPDHLAEVIAALGGQHLQCA
jgi:hypothetical protein